MVNDPKIFPYHPLPEGWTRYVVGFAFDETWTGVVLIKKKRPFWQAGLLNGVGGHVEPGETVFEAMPREFEEETGLKTTGREWHLFCNMRYFPRKGVVSFFVRPGNADVLQVKSMTDENVNVVPLSDLHTFQVMDSLTWLIPMARCWKDGTLIANVDER